MTNLYHQHKFHCTLLLQYDFLLFQLTNDLETDYRELRLALQEIAPKIYKELEDQFENHLFILSQRGPKSMTWKIRG